MARGIVVSLTEDGKLELPSEILSRFPPNIQFEVSVSEDKIILKKLSAPTVDLDDFFQRLEQQPADLDKLSLKEISELVKEVRRERRAR